MKKPNVFAVVLAAAESPALRIKKAKMLPQRIASRRRYHRPKTPTDFCNC